MKRVKKTANGMTIPITLAVKLASIVVHADEYTDPDAAHAFDSAAIRQLVEDKEVVKWLKGLGALAPVKR